MDKIKAIENEQLRKDELVLNDNDSDNNNEKLENYIKNNNYSNIKETNKNKKTNHRPTSPYKQPPINPYFVKMVSELGYDENYVIKSLNNFSRTIMLTGDN